MSKFHFFYNKTNTVPFNLFSFWARFVIIWLYLNASSRVSGSKYGHKRDIVSSKLCDPNVKQYSGYIQTSDKSNIFFWLFESRNDPYNSPLTLFVNGGPGCSSMIGLFQEMGPCRSHKNGTGTYVNPYSWNEVSNLLFVDQPTGTGFSYGINYSSTTDQAASTLYEFLQQWFAQFPQYATMDFHFFGESYAGHYIPTTAKLILKNNDLHTKNSSQFIKLKSIGIGNGWIDPIIQFASFVEYAEDNPYVKFLSEDLLAQLHNHFPRCKAMIQQCYNTNSMDHCIEAGDWCFFNYFMLYASSGINTYDVRTLNTTADYWPPPDYNNYLSKPEVLRAIGAQTKYVECSDVTYGKFLQTADDIRSILPALSFVVDKGISTLLYYGDADASCNWIGGLNVAKAIQWSEKSKFNCAPFREFSFADSTVGQIQSYSSLSYIKIFHSGHEVPFYQPKNSLEIFSRWINNQKI